MTTDTFSFEGKTLENSQTNIFISFTQINSYVIAGTSPINISILYSYIHIFKLLYSPSKYIFYTVIRIILECFSFSINF